MTNFFQPIAPEKPLEPIEDIGEWTQKRAWPLAQGVIEKVLNGSVDANSQQAKVAIAILQMQAKVKGPLVTNEDNSALTSIFVNLDNQAYNPQPPPK